MKPPFPLSSPSLTSQSSSEGKDSNSTSSSPPSCNDDLCPRILSTTIHNSSLYVFARTAEDHITYRTHNGSGWSGSWTDLGKPVGNVVSQPTSLSWNVGGKTSHLDVIAMSSSGRSVNERWYSDEEGWAPENGDGWADCGCSAGSAVVMCDARDRLDLWVTDVGSPERDGTCGGRMRRTSARGMGWSSWDCW